MNSFIHVCIKNRVNWGCSLYVTIQPNLYDCMNMIFIAGGGAGKGGGRVENFVFRAPFIFPLFFLPHIFLLSESRPYLSPSLSLSLTVS